MLSYRNYPIPAYGDGTVTARSVMRNHLTGSVAEVW